MKTPRAWFLLVPSFVCLMTILIPGGDGHSDVYPVQGKEPIIYPPPLDAFRRLKPQPVSWMAWWEANRDPYLEVIRQGLDQKPDPKLLADRRKQAVESLLANVQSDSVAIRASAALALGQIGEEKAFDSLVELARKDKEVQVRQAAFLAIGLLDIPKAEQILTEAAFKPFPQVEKSFPDKPTDRQAALLACGLMNRLSPDTIVNLQKMSCRWLTMSPITAWALTRPLDPQDPTAPELCHDSGKNSKKQVLAEGSGLADSAISCWALARLEDPAHCRLLQEALAKTNVPWTASEAMLSLGSHASVESLVALSELLLAAPRGKALPTYKMLDDQNDRLAYLWEVRQSKIVREDIKQGGKGVQAQNAYIGAFIKAIGGETINRRTPGNEWGAYQLLYSQLHFGGDDYDARQYKGQTIREYHWLGLAARNEKPYIAYYINLGVEPVFIANLRASAAIAMGQIDSSASREALRKVLAGKDDEYSDAFKSMAIMSLGQLGDAEAVPVLAELVHPTAPRGVVISKERIQSPLRGFAAVAMGLYSRPVKTPQGMVNRKDYDKVCLLLAERVADRNEPEDFRAACALALGLSGRTENLKYLQTVSNTVTGRDDLLSGYVILSRGMLCDKTIMEPANSFLAAASNRTDKNGILGRRAAVLGLGLTGSREAIPTLANSWDMGYHVARETALALSFCQGFDVTDKIVGVVNDVKAKPETRALAARCLGELFMKERPSRLARLVNGSNYAMRIPRLMYYRALANEFLFTYLLAPSADEWEAVCPQ